MKIHRLALAITSLLTAVAYAEKPNVIFILMDDMGYSDVSCYGAKKVNTPNIDRLAKEGLQFTDFHTGSPICSPSRAAFLTGAYPQRNGLYMGINENREAHWFLGLSPEEITIAEQFKKKDYVTLMVGKWHLGHGEKFSYYHQGFDHYYGAPSNMGHNPEFLDEKKVVYKKTPLDQLTKLYTARIVKHIKDYKDKPFFLYYAHNYPHTPVTSGAEFKGSSKDGPRGDAIQEIDWGIGEIVKALEENGILENTLIIFTSDNGPTNARHAAPYRGTKYVTLEGGHRVPFILNWKGKTQKPAVLDVSVNAMDLFPTLSEIINQPVPDDRIYDGVSLLPLFKGEEINRAEDKPFFYYNCENLEAVRVGKWKLHVPTTKKEMAWWDQRKTPIQKPELYDLSSDKAESVNLADAHPERVSEMTKLVEAMQLKLGSYQSRGSEQRPTGTLFPEVPVVSNHRTDWPKLSDKEKGRAKTEFKPSGKPKRTNRKPKRK
ncbi:arylsulfatase [Oceaniferula spumae]|uniref:Arylsulfatase n=1 Tax=Oceaniferula spumae TaxID=2979115 RepID=A0AAT9FIW5_9BACT